MVGFNFVLWFITPANTVFLCVRGFRSVVTGASDSKVNKIQAELVPWWSNNWDVPAMGSFWGVRRFNGLTQTPASRWQDMAHKPSIARINEEQGSTSPLVDHCIFTLLWNIFLFLFSHVHRPRKGPALFMCSVRGINSCWFDSKTALLVVHPHKHADTPTHTFHPF